MVIRQLWPCLWALMACDSPSAGTCVPGAQQVCGCAGGLTGFQTCLPSGTQYSECSCQAIDAGVADTGVPDSQPLDAPSQPRDAPVDAAPACGDGTVVAGEYCLRLSPTTLSAPQNDVVSLDAGDINEDGNPDLVVANVSGLVVFLSTGPAQFSTGAFIPLADAVSARLSDMDGDAHLDLVVGRQIGTNLVTILWGSGNGAFPQQLSIMNSFTSTVSRIAIADMNNDGRQDIVASSSQSGGPRILLALNNGARAFSASGVAPLPTNVQGGPVTLGDFDGDGLPDIVSGLASGNDFATSYVFMNLGSGTFANGIPLPQVTCPGPTASDCFMSTMASGRFNGDSYDDIAVGMGGVVQKGIAIEMSSGQSGLFSLPLFHNVGNNFGWPSVADVNSDGTSDIVMPLMQMDELVVLLGDGSGAFAVQPAMTVSPLGRRPAEVVVADINQDGALDIATANNLTRNISLFLSDP